MPADALRDLELLCRSNHGLIHLDTDEETRSNGLLRHVAARLRLPFYTWTRSRGIVRANVEGPIYETTEPVQAFRHIAASGYEALYHLRGLGNQLENNAALAAHLRDAAETMREVTGAIVLTGADAVFPGPLRELVAVVTLPGPSDKELRELCQRIVRDLSERQRVEVRLTKDDVRRLVAHLSGLTLMEAEKILTKAIIEDGVLDVDDLELVLEAKRRIIEEEGLLEYYPAETSMARVAGLEPLKAWLGKREAVVRSPDEARAFGLDFPRGVLLLGVPGCGKSLSARAVATQWKLPLLRLDPSNLYDKYIGQSETNFKRAMATAERMAPVILWIDELEKAFASGGGEDGGVSRRVLGSFLSWLQERDGDVFVVATANDVQSLPPEFLRKGRFDEIFFVDLPDAATRQEVFRIHLESRGHDPGLFDAAALAAETEGFSGSEIEQVVVSALYTVFSAGAPLTLAALRAAIAETVPLSVTMGEKIDAMRTWARGRTVPAN